MDSAKAAMKKNTAMFDSMGDKIPQIKDFAASQGLNSGTFIGIGLGLFSLFMIIFHGFEIAITTYTVIYPGFCSMRAIETAGKDDDKHWLTYWMVVGVLEVLETFLGFIFWLIPYWGILRFGLFVWMISFNGAVTLYTMLQPLIKAHKDEI
jgi:receptor expression-enhancing protein 5/6